MFTQLTELLRKGDTLSLTITREADKSADDAAPGGPTGPVFRVNIYPKLFTTDGEHGADRKALNEPLTVTGTAAELDSPEFLNTLNRFATSTNSLRNTIDDVEKAHQEAKENKSKSRPTPPPPAKTAVASKTMAAATGKKQEKAAEKEQPAAEEEPTESASLGI